MKNLFGIFSLAVLLFSTFAPAFTYATEVEEEAKQILTETLDETMSEFDESHDVAEIEEFNVDSRNTYETDDEWNTATLTTNNDGSKTLVRNDINVTIAGEDLGEYYWGFDTPVGESERNETTSTSGAEFNDIWGGKDDSVPNGFDSGLNSKRRGPCGEGWHVPSRGERSELMIAWCHLSTNNCSENKIVHLSYYNANYKNIYLYLNGVTPKLYEDFNFITKRQYRSSTPYYSTQAYYFYTTAGTQYDGAYSDTTNGRNGVWQDGTYFPGYVRCFKDYYPPKEITFNANGGTFSGGATIEQHTYNYSGSDVIPIYNIQIPDRKATEGENYSGWMFAGWYTTATNQTEEFDINNPQTTTAYAKWLPFNDLKVNLGDMELVIMDRNLGAEEESEGLFKVDNNNNPEDNRKLGYFYQWGNNYGFKNSGQPMHSDNNQRIELEGYGPNNYYYSNVFKKIGGDPYRWTYNNDRNLWGGENINSSEEDRKGPCPEGYHIPNSYERETIYNTIANNKNLIGCDIYNSYSDFVKCFTSKFRIPIAGFARSNYASFEDKGVDTNLRSSTPGPDSYSAKALGIRESYISTLYGYVRRGNGYSVRCFKNNIETKNLNIISNDGKHIRSETFNWWNSLSDYVKDLTIYGYQFSGEYKSIDGKNINEWNYLKNINAYYNKNPSYSYNANGGAFENGKGEKQTKYTLIKKTSHTHNILEDQSTYANYDYNLDVNDVIVITGANSLNIKFTKNRNNTTPSDMFSRRGNDDFDFITIWTGVQYDYRGFNDQDKSIFGRKEIKDGWGNNMPEITITGDSVTIGFTSYGGGNSYGYFATITGLVYVDDDGNYLSSMQIDNIPSRPGYEFIGWYETGETSPFNFNTPVTEDRIFYAKWNPHNYIIKFNTNGGTGEINNINATYGEEKNLPIVTREGYVFKGWKSEDGIIYTNIIPEGTGVTTDDGVVVTLTAQWEEIKEQSPSAGGGSIINPSNQKSEITEQEHNSANTENTTEQENTKTTDTQTTNNPTIKEQVRKVEERSLTRGEVAVMTDILLEVFPQLVECRELQDVTKACSSYADEQNFTKDEKKAITRLCRLSIMGIHNDDNKPLDEFLVKQKATNGEFATVMDRVVSDYNEKDLATVKEALKKLENDEQSVVFGTVFDVFMSIKNIFN